MLDQELGTAGLEMRIGGQRRSTLNEAVVCSGRICVGGRASIVEGGEDTRRTSFLNEVAHNLVVEVLDRCPLDLFSDVFFLFRLQCQFNEDLLELLVDVVNAKLLKGVVLRDHFRTSFVAICDQLTSKISKPKMSYVDAAMSTVQV